MDDKVFTFSVEVEGDVLSFNSYRILDDSGKLVGAFVLQEGQRVACFIAGARYPACIAVSTGDSFYFTPTDGADGKINGAYITDYKLNPISILVNKAI